MANDGRLILNKMMTESDVTDQTDLMRELKHSIRLRPDVDRIIHLRDNIYPDDLELLKYECTQQCPFMYRCYTDIFNKLIKREICEKIFYNFLDELEKIENGKSTQHEASVAIGELLKKLYVDSALRHKQKVEEGEEKAAETAEEPRQVVSGVVSVTDWWKSQNKKIEKFATLNTFDLPPVVIKKKNKSMNRGKNHKKRVKETN